MSWLAVRSFVKTLRGDEDDDDEGNDRHEEEKSHSHGEEEGGGGGEGDETRGVKEDLSELTQTLTRQFWGVASFLAPPPSAEPSSSDPDPVLEPLGSPRLDGIRSDFAEIGGKFRSGISMISNVKAVTEISKIASSFLPFGSDDEEEGESEGIEEIYEGGGAIGVTEDVVAFANNVSLHPETWLDFPLSPYEDSDAFDMSDSQQEHALAVERFAPTLAALRIELCPSHMSEGHFWKIYFVLLHSRLNKHDAELLSTPQIVQAREMLLQDVPIRTKAKPETSDRGVSSSYSKEEVSSVPPEESVISPSEASSEALPTKTDKHEESTISVPITDLETQKHPVQTTEVEIIDKSVTEEDSIVHAKSRDIQSDTSNVIPIQKCEDDGDEWLDEETGETSGTGGSIPLGNDEDVTFSDLEDDDDQGEPKDSKATSRTKPSSTGPQNKESLNVDDFNDV